MTITRAVGGGLALTTDAIATAARQHVELAAAGAGRAARVRAVRVAEARARDTLEIRPVALLVAFGLVVAAHAGAAGRGHFAKGARRRAPRVAERRAGRAVEVRAVTLLAGFDGVVATRRHARRHVVMTRVAVRIGRRITGRLRTRDAAAVAEIGAGLGDRRAVALLVVGRSHDAIATRRTARGGQRRARAVAARARRRVRARRAVRRALITDLVARVGVAIAAVRRLLGRVLRFAIGRAARARHAAIGRRRVGAGLAVEHVALIADLASDGVGHAVTACDRGAVRIARGARSNGERDRGGEAAMRIALLSRIDDAVAAADDMTLDVARAHRGRRAVGRAAIAVFARSLESIAADVDQALRGTRHGVCVVRAVVALLADRAADRLDQRVDLAVTAARRRAIVVTRRGLERHTAGARIAVFVAMRAGQIDDVVATHVRRAIILAVVAVDRVTIVTLLAGVEHAVATARAVHAVVFAAAAGRVAVVADLAEVLDAVAAALVRLAVRGAAVGQTRAGGAVRGAIAPVVVARALAREGVAVVANFTLRGIDDAVAAGLVRSAVGRTAVAGDGVAVVADFASVGVRHAVAADLGRLAVRGTTVAVDDVAVVADLAWIDDAVAAAIADADLLDCRTLQRIWTDDAARTFVGGRFVRAATRGSD